MQTPTTSGCTCNETSIGMDCPLHVFRGTWRGVRFIHTEPIGNRHERRKKEKLRQLGKSVSS